MRTRIQLGILLFVWIPFCAQAGKIDTVWTQSTVMRKEIKAVVVTPEAYQQGKALPVVYLLHGYSGSYKDWSVRVPELAQLADQHQVLIVCPDGGFGSWYWDSPVDSNSQYETYVCSELVPWIDARYKTIASPKGRGITGLSMGGHGGMYLALRHPDLFGVGGSMSGGVDIRPFPNNWDMAKKMGRYADFPARWESNTVINLLHLYQPSSQSFIIDCGTEDFFYAVNERLHQEMLYRKIPHDYIVRPGAHNWEYWQKALPYQLLYMKQFFDKQVSR